MTCTQPLLYFFVFYAYWDLLDRGQKICGQIVAVREGIYAILVLISVFVNPAVFIVDLKSSWKYDKIQGLVYVVAPEKFIYTGLIGNGVVDVLYLLGFGSLLILDGAGIVAFVWAIAAKNVYPAMMIGYTITTMGGIFTGGYLCFEYFQCWTGH